MAHPVCLRILLPVAALGVAAMLGGCVVYPSYPAYSYGYAPSYSGGYVALGGGGWHEGRWHDHGGRWHDHDGDWRR
jgi:hypothetical protein